MKYVCLCVCLHMYVHALSILLSYQQIYITAHIIFDYTIYEICVRVCMPAHACAHELLIGTLFINVC